MNNYICIFGDDTYSYKIKVTANTVLEAQSIATSLVEMELNSLPLKDIILVREK